MNAREDWSDDEKEMLCLRAQQLRKANPAIRQERLFLESQKCLMPERRHCCWDYERFAWLILASHRGSISVMAAKIDEVHRMLVKLTEAAVQPAEVWIPLESSDKPDGSHRKLMNRLGLTVEDTEAVDELIAEIRSDDPFRGMA